MKVGPKYKIARRLGAPVFEKTQTQKFALSLAKKSSGQKSRTHRSQVTDYGFQIKEKQKARYSYLLTEKQFSKYVKKALTQSSADKAGLLFEILERRLDNVVLRAGLASTRGAARQMVSHGHITVNGRKVDIPSFETKIGDKINIKDSSLGKGIARNMEEKSNELNTPEWIKFDPNKKEAEITTKPNLGKVDNLFNLNTVLEFYSR